MAESGASISSMIFLALFHLFAAYIIDYVIGKIFRQQLVGRRNKLASDQRERYYQNLTDSIAQLEADNAKKDEDVSKRIQKLEDERAKLRNELDDTCDENDTQEKLEKEKNLCIWRQNELSRLESELPQVDVKNDSLDDMTKSYEEENEFLSKVVKGTITYSTITEPDADVMKFLEEHSSDLPKDSMKEIYDRLLELKATDALKDIEEFGQSDSTGLMNNLEIDKKKVELDLQKIKKRHDKEFDSLKDTRLDYMIRMRTAQMHLNTLKEINDITERLIIPSSNCEVVESM